MKIVKKQEEWSAVSKELEKEKLKLKSYDETLLELFGKVKGKKVLDYGCGPGILASVVKKLDGEMYAYDLSEKMRKLCAEKIGKEQVFETSKKIPENFFDIVICNLVLCIVDEPEVQRISERISKILKKQGSAFVGFCNPLIFDVPESQLDFRTQTKHRYAENHTYMKIKKEGKYEIVEIHRPTEWYEKVFRKAGLKVEEKFFTPEYTLKGKKIQDFIIFKLKKM